MRSSTVDVLLLITITIVPCSSVSQTTSMLAPIDNSAAHGLRFGLSSDLGERASRFGFGHSGSIGRFSGAILDRIVLQGGIARWLTPAPATLYPDAVLTNAMRASESSVEASVVFGFSYRFVGTRDTLSGDPFYDPDSVNSFRAKSDTALSEPTNGKDLEHEIAYKLRALQARRREPIAAFGALFRLGPVYDDEPNLSTISSVDLYAACSWFVWDVEATIGLRYLIDLDDAYLGQSSPALTIGAFNDVGTQQRPIKIGAQLGLSWFQFETITRTLDGGGVVSSTPQSWRTEFTVTLTGAPSRDGNANATVGVMLVDEGVIGSALRASTESKLKILLLFSSDFALFDE